MKILSAVLLASFALSGCGAISGKPMGAGSIYSNVKFNEQISDNTLGTKAGEACASSILIGASRAHYDGVARALRVRRGRQLGGGRGASPARAGR